MSLTNWTILVVEDEPDSVYLASELLSHYGANVITVMNGQECMDELQVTQPTAIVMDLSMPVKDGWKTLKEIRSNPSMHGIPIVAITAYHSASVAQDAINAGFDAYFAKPLDPDNFVEALTELVS